jgi:putative methionine-R-sulfoxide reductase with GAF domain
MKARGYSEITVAASGTREARMRAFVDACWPVLSPHGVSWIGFYVGPGESLEDGRRAGAGEMLLGPRRDKPACSPIGLHGVCGRGWRERRSIVVRDVRVLGPDYVACDPRDQSEVVVPLLGADGACCGVLDVDSFDVGAFTPRDARELARLLVGCGLLDAAAAARMEVAEF